MVYRGVMAAKKGTISNGTAVKKAAMLQALEKSMGVVTPACDAVGIARKTHYEWLKNDGAYAAAVDLVREGTIDFAESELYKQIKAGQVAATIFYLKTKGKHRGYVERSEHTGANGTPLMNPNITVVAGPALANSEDGIDEDIAP